MPPPVRSKKRDDFYRDRRRRKVCAFCADKTVQIDYKEVNRLRRYLSERAKIEPRSASSPNAKSDEGRDRNTGNAVTVKILRPDIVVAQEVKLEE